MDKVQNIGYFDSGLVQVHYDDLGAQKRKAPAADPLTGISETEHLAAAVAWEKAHNAASKIQRIVIFFILFYFESVD